MDRLKSMKDCLMTCAESQMMNLSEVNAEELGEVIDMIKDLEEAMYYCSIVKAMEEGDEDKKKETHHYYTERVIYPKDEYERDMDKEHGRMYYTPSPSTAGGRTSTPGAYGTTHYYTETMGMRDGKEGKSPMQRKMYMEAKEQHRDKATQLKELEKYMNELCEDMTEMIIDASPEERQFFERKLSQLATKISNV